MLGGAESAALAAGLFVADFVSHFAGMLGVMEAPDFAQLHVSCVSVLADADAGCLLRERGACVNVHVVRELP